MTSDGGFPANARALLAAAFLAAGLVGWVGCEGDGGDGGDGAPNVAGSWSGSYYLLEPQTLNHYRTARLTATVTQQGSSVSITTTKSGTAHYLTGAIDASGNMDLRDSYDGEHWTTYHRPATASSIEINDFIYANELETVSISGRYVLATLELSR